MRYREDNPDDIEFIERFYEDIESGYRALGKTYVRPDDYIERALRIMNASAKRNRRLNQFEGRSNENHR